jgi:putative hydrolase of the HAD superfamily
LFPAATRPILTAPDVKALLLDLYDTIVWTDWLALSRLLESRLGVDGVTLMRAFETTRAQRGIGRYGDVAGDLGALAAACGAIAGEDRWAGLASDTVALLKRSIRLFDDVLPVVEQLRSGGIPVAVISNCDHATRPVVDALGLPSHFDAMVLSCEVGSLKPEPAIFVEALRRLEVTAADSVFVDDQAAYLDGAAALGIRTFRMARPGSSDATEGGDAHPVISELSQLLFRGAVAV